MKTNGARATLTLALLTSFASSGALADVAANKMTYLPLETNGGVLNPGVIVGFNPQPDPPGFPTLNLANPREPILVQPAGPTTLDFVMSFSGLPGLLLPAVQKPNADGATDFAFEYGDHTFDVTLTFSGPGAIRDWVSFNPQPDPARQHAPATPRPLTEPASQRRREWSPLRPLTSRSGSRLSGCSQSQW